MNEQLLPFFEKYEAISNSVEQAFERVRNQFPDRVKCKPLCSDCCFAVFDITLIEALYINHKFRDRFRGDKLEALLEECNKADRTLYRLKKNAFIDVESGKEENEILKDAAETRVRCPMLNEKQMCEIYEFRPITCKLYGIPNAIAGQGHTCGLSGFEKGGSYPTAKLDLIQNKLLELSAELSGHIKSRYSRIGEMIVPLSMALLTVYDDEYLGISDEEK